jgi:hypothetical protein
MGTLAGSDGDMLPPKRALALAAFMALGFVLTLALTFLMPQNRYVRYQQARDSIMFHAQWIYERTRYDPTQIDVAIVGSSRLEAGVSPSILSQALSEQLQRPVRVANLSLVRPGRDFTYEVVKDLLESHSEVKLIVLANDGEQVDSHPLFKSVADCGDILRAPILLNTKYFVNLFYLPYRNISYSAQTLLPWAFGVRSGFDRKRYLGADLDRTFGYKTPTGEMVNGDRGSTETELKSSGREVVAKQVRDMRLFHLLPADEADAVDRTYVRRIYALASSRGVRVAFFSIPMYGPDQLPNDARFYQQFGPVISVADLSLQAKYYANGGHLNRSGAVVATGRLGAALASYLKLGPQSLSNGRTSP